VAATEAKTSLKPRSTSLKPVMVLMTMGKKAMAVTTSSLEWKPAPTHTRIRGAMAILGTLWSATKIGIRHLSTRVKRIMMAETSSAKKTAQT